MTVRLIISSGIFVTHGTRSRSTVSLRASNEFAHRVPFHSFAKSSGETRASGGARGQGGLYIEAFEVLGLLGSNPFVRSRARQAVIV